MFRIKRMLGRLWSGLTSLLRRQSDKPYRDLSRDVIETINFARPFTQTSVERIAALCEAVKYIVRCAVPGDIVECGVWRGGSMMAVAKILLNLGCTNRELHLFDTFQGMSAPGEYDVSLGGASAAQLLRKQCRDNPWSAWCYSPLEEVRRNMTRTGYASNRIHYVVGKVEETLPDKAPDRIALLRLDTDWYESTRHELEHLFPHLSPGAVLIIDDYGHWKGARCAVDEYFSKQNVPMFLHRIDYTGRIGVYYPLEKAISPLQDAKAA